MKSRSEVNIREKTTAFDFQPEFRKTVLGNGVRVVTEHHPFSRSTSAAIYVEIGTRDESIGINGAAHFVEHLVFKGTKSRSAFEIAKSLESVGGELNAYTSREVTCFHATSLREHLPLSLDVLVDLVGGAVFDSKEFVKEKDVILQEIDMSAEVIEDYIFDLYFEKVFSGHALGMPILGTPKSLNRISRKDLFDFYHHRYGGRNLVVSVAGDVDHDRVLELVGKSLSRSRNYSVRKKRVRPKQKAFTQVISRPSEQVHMLIGFPSGAFTDSERFESYIVNAALGGGMTSRLYQKVREDRGLVYSIYSYLHSFTDCGSIMIYAGSSQKNAPKVLKIISMEIKKLLKKGLSKRELDFFKTQVKGSILLGSDDVESRMNSIAVNEMVFGEYRPVDEVVAQIDKVSLGSIHEYLERFIDFNKSGVMLVGDVDEEKGSRWVENSFEK